MAASQILFLKHIDAETTIVFLFVILLLYYIMRKKKNLPPGPFVTFPIIGNTLQLAGKNPLLVFKDMRKRYGDVFSFSIIGNTPIIVLNGYDTIREALLKRGRVFSDRPINYLSQCVCDNKGLILHSGEFWREQRHFTMNVLKTNAFTRGNLEKGIIKEAAFFNTFLASKVGCSFNLRRILQICSFNIMSGMLLSERFDYGDPVINTYLDDLEEILLVVGSNGPLVNSYPILRYLPGDPLKMKESLKNVARRTLLLSEIYSKHEKSLDKNNPKDFMDTYMIEICRRSNEVSNFTKEQLLYLVSDLTGAGTDTTASTIAWIVWHLRENPSIQKKLQAEILDKIGSQKSPTLQDQSKLQYVDAVVMEAMRISNAAPLGVPHATSEDITFRGYDIPKGTMILANFHSIYTDPHIWEVPEEFRPGRFLDTDGSLLKVNEFIPFSIGKRICMGEALARAELFLTITSVYQRFSLVAPEGEFTGKNEGILGITLNPKPFRVRIVLGRL